MSSDNEKRLRLPWQAWLVSSGAASLRCMFMLCARFMTSRVNVNNAICRRSVHEISFKRSAFDFMHSNRLCRWRYLLSLGEESMRACNINIHLGDSSRTNYKTFDKKSFNLSLLGLPKNSSGAPSSLMTPS